MIGTLWFNYFNMGENKIKFTLKRRRPSKIRYSANKVFTSIAEFKHTNSKATGLLYIFDKKKLSVLKLLSSHALNFFKEKKQLFVKYGFVKSNIANVSMRKKVKKTESVRIKDRCYNIHENNYVTYSENILNSYLSDTIHYRSDLSKDNILAEHNESKTRLTNIVLKKSNILLNYRELGIISIIKETLNKTITMKVAALKSVHLNSAILGSAIALKLRDRHNKAIRVLNKAILCTVRVPSLHTLRTYYYYIEKVNKFNILSSISQQVVSGVRLEAKGRLTKRLTAMRAVLKVKYVGSLKNISSSLNGIPSSLLRGYVKSNAQLTTINDKTRNGAFGLNTFVSSHSLLLPCFFAIHTSIITILGELKKNNRVS